MFLTNTLEPIEPQANLLLPAVSAEVKAAQKVKDREILVITGNPPYSYQSKNRGSWITKLIDGYRFVDGQKMKERVSQGLLDDYVKFMRFSQIKMDAVDEGIVAIITNHSWLDRDHLTIHFERDSTWRTVTRFIEIDESEARREFGLGRDARDWKITRAQEDLRESGPRIDLVTKIQYRPFDNRWTYHTGRARGFIGWPVEKIWSAMLKNNICMAVSRMTKGESFSHVMASENMFEKIGLSSKTSNNAFVFPLMIGGAENIRIDFRAFIDSHYEHHYTPEEIFGYIYAILYAPSYRSRYSEFLRIDFPRIPFPESADDLEALSDLGWALGQAHLLRDLPRRGLAAYQGRGDHLVEAVRYSPQEQAIHINKAQCFRPMPPEVWNFHIGGYQVLDKYLKSRKGRTLTLDEINHVGAVADSLAFTIEQMTKIDVAYQAAFPERG